MMRLLKPVVKIWRKKHPRKCRQCNNISNGELYDKCYSCYIDDKVKCESCGKMISKEYTNCYTCKFKYECIKCGTKMANDKYKCCYKCNKSKMFLK